MFCLFQDTSSSGHLGFGALPVSKRALGEVTNADGAAPGIEVSSPGGAPRLLYCPSASRPLARLFDYGNAAASYDTHDKQPASFYGVSKQPQDQQQDWAQENNFASGSAKSPRLHSPPAAQASSGTKAAHAAGWPLRPVGQAGAVGGGLMGSAQAAGNGSAYVGAYGSAADACNAGCGPGQSKVHGVPAGGMGCGGFGSPLVGGGVDGMDAEAPVVMCNCGERMPMKTCYNGRNAGREFYACPKPRVGFFIIRPIRTTPI